MAAVRIIACLDIFEGQVVKGIKFGNHRVVGDPLELAKRYSDQGIDELVFYDIGASPKNKIFDEKLIEKIARTINIPFTVAGGIRSLEDAKNAISAGADKISINSAAVGRPRLVTEIAQELGSQAVVVGVDCREGKVFRFTGRAETTEKTTLNVFDWCQQLETLGCGEIVLNCMDSDGTNGGGNLNLMRALRAVVSVPLIASGGLGNPQQFGQMILDSGVDGALGASIFHNNIFQISDVKKYLSGLGIEVRI